MFQGDEQLSIFTATKNILAPGTNTFFRSLKTNLTLHLDSFASLSRQIDTEGNRHESSFEICQYNWIAWCIYAIFPGFFAHLRRCANVLKIKFLTNSIASFET